MPGLWLILLGGGLVSGILAGLLGIGGGTVLVPLLVALGVTPVQAVATSTLAIVITALSGSIQNWRMGYFDSRRVFSLGVPALVTAQAGVYLADRIAPEVLLVAFGLYLMVNLICFEVRQRPVLLPERENPHVLHPQIIRLGTGGLAGLVSGLFGVGGGVVMVPLQRWLLREPLKVAIQTSLGVVVITAVSALIGHGLRGNVLGLQGIVLGVGGLLGAQLSTRFLPRLPDQAVSVGFRLLLALLCLYILKQAWSSY